jgi:hypothetical protein
MPVEEAKSCCSGTTGQHGGCDDAPEDALQVSDSRISVVVPSAEVVEFIRPEPVASMVKHEQTLRSEAIYIAPAYIQFQSFLI